MGMSSNEWSRYLHDELGLPEPPEEINEEVVRRMSDLYREHLPLLPGAREAVERLAARWPLGLATSSNRPIIELVLDLAGLTGSFQRVGLVGGGRTRQAGAGRLPRGGAPAGRRRPTTAPRSRTRTTASARRKAAGMTVVAIPNRLFPPDEEALALADCVLDSLEDLTVESVILADQRHPVAAR